MKTQQRERKINTSRSYKASSRWNKSVVSIGWLKSRETPASLKFGKRILVVTSNVCVSYSKQIGTTQIGCA